MDLCIITESHRTSSEDTGPACLIDRYSLLTPSLSRALILWFRSWSSLHHGPDCFFLSTNWVSTTCHLWNCPIGLLHLSTCITKHCLIKHSIQVPSLTQLPSGTPEYWWLVLRGPALQRCLIGSYNLEGPESLCLNSTTLLAERFPSSMSRWALRSMQCCAPNKALGSSRILLVNLSTSFGFPARWKEINHAGTMPIIGPAPVIARHGVEIK